MLTQAAYHWIVSVSFLPADSFASLRAAFGFFSGHLASEGELLAWQGIRHFAAEGSRHTLHFLSESDLHRRDAALYVQSLLLGHPDLTTRQPTWERDGSTTSAIFHPAFTSSEL